MTTDRNEIEALADAATALDAAAEIIALIVPTNDAIRRCRGHANNLRELARRLAAQPLLSPEPPPLSNASEQPAMAYTLERMSQDYDTTGRVVEAAALRMAATLVRREKHPTQRGGEGT